MCCVRSVAVKSLIALALAAITLGACARTVIRDAPEPRTLRSVASARVAMDSARTRLLVRDGIIDTIAFLDSLPDAEVISLPLNALPRMIALIYRCSDTDTSRAMLRRTVITRFAKCPWSAFPTAER
jgi:hypothetical protein